MIVKGSQDVSYLSKNNYTVLYCRQLPAGG